MAGNAPSIVFVNDRLSVRFDRFDLPSYELFLRAKRLPESRVTLDDTDEGMAWTIDAPAYLAPMLGVAVPQDLRADLPLSGFLFDDQQEIVARALAVKRFACWSDCGLGKTPIGLEFARQVMHRTGRRVLIVSLNEIVGQWLSEAEKFYGPSLPIMRLTHREDMRRWMAGSYAEDGCPDLAVVNYEKWNPPSLAEQVVSEARHLAAIILDESSRLKTGGGKQKWALIKSCRGVEYKLSLTATPAPNEVMEFASQASFLEKLRNEAEILWTYFRRDEKTHRWTVKAHARSAFFEFMAGWSIYVRDPRRYGWRKDFPEVPAPVTLRHPIRPTAEQIALLPQASADTATGQMDLFPQTKDPNFVQAGWLSQLAKGFRYIREEKGEFERVASRKPELVARLVADEVAAGAQVLVWTVFDAESQILAEELAAHALPHDLLTGKVPRNKRSTILDRFRAGECRVLVSRPSMLGYGLNFQFVSAMVFSGFSFSYESQYQAVRRAYRFGQKERLRVHIPYVERFEDAMLDALERKQAEHERSIEEMEANYVRARAALQGRAE